MMENLYRQVIMEHYKNPRNKGLKLQGKINHLHNPSCGDDIKVEVIVKDGVIDHIYHEGSGCSICCSSASVMSELLTGKTTKEALHIIDTYYKMIKGEEEIDEEILEEAIAYQGVAKFPARTKCATISWKAAEEILGEENGKKES